MRDYDGFIRGELHRAAAPANYTIDCFVSSEVAYNDVLRRCMPVGDAPRGAWLGVGPDQNFTYIGALRPQFAVILDARLDNLLEHLLFKLLFAEARGPLDYLCMLLGRRRPVGDLADPAAASGKAVLARLSEQPLDEEHEKASRARVESVFAARWGANAEILRRVERIQMEFVRRQLRVTSVSESCLANLDKIPDFGEVIGATTAEGFNLHYLTCPDHFAYVKDLHARDRIVPMVGNVTDPTAIARVRDLLGETGLRLSAVYLSNLEEFLLQRYVISNDRITERPNPHGDLTGSAGAAYERLLQQLEALPCDDDAVLIRFYFPGEHRGRSLGVFPWLDGHVTFLRDFLRRVRAEQPESVMATYV